MQIYRYIDNKCPRKKILDYGDIYPFEGIEADITKQMEKYLFFCPENCSGSDGAGGLASLSNYQVFIRDYKKVRGIYILTGGYSTYGIAVRYDIYENNNEIREAVNFLESYCLLDEDHYSELEREWEIEAVSNVYDDIYRIISHDEEIPDDNEDADNNELIEQWTWNAVEQLNLNFINEFRSSYLDAKDVYPFIKDMLLINMGNLPLLTNREWSCEYTKEIYLEKLEQGVQYA